MPLLGAAAFVAGGVWILGQGPVGLVIGIASIAFFGLIGIYFLAILVSWRPILQIDDDGITDRASLASVGRLGWREIDAVRIYSVGNQRMLEIVPRDVEAVLVRTGLVRRAVMRMNSRLGLPSVNVPEQALPYSLETLIDELRRHNPDLRVSQE